MKYSKWRTAYFCADCCGQLSYDAMMSSGGTCPMCGAHNRSTIVYCKEKAYRWRYEPRERWWKMRKRTREWLEVSP